MDQPKNTPADLCKFGFYYEISTAQPLRGANFTITTKLINAADQTYYVWFVGSSTFRVPTAKATLYTMVDGKEHILCSDLVGTADIIEQ